MTIRVRAGDKTKQGGSSGQKKIKRGQYGERVRDDTAGNETTDGKRPKTGVKLCGKRDEKKTTKGGDQWKLQQHRMRVLKDVDCHIGAAGKSSGQTRRNAMSEQSGGCR